MASNHNLLTAMRDTFRRYQPELIAGKLSVCAGYLLHEVVVTSNYHPMYTDRKTAEVGGTLLEQRVGKLFALADVTPDCYLATTHGDQLVGVAVGGETNLEVQPRLAAAIAAGITGRYQELCQ